MEADLRRLNDALRESELNGHYWLWSGVILGWARTGSVLPNDHDADFGIMREDLWRLESAIEILGRAGFRPMWRIVANDGSIEDLAFRRRGIKYEFMLFDRVDDGLRYRAFGEIGDQIFQHDVVIPAQSLVPFQFLRRTWMRHADIDLELSTVYGDWRRPDPSWYFMTDNLAIRSTEVAVNQVPEWEWDGSIDYRTTPA